MSIGDDDDGAGGSTADATAAAAGDDSDDPGQLVLGIVIGLVAGGPSPPPPAAAPPFWRGLSFGSEAFYELPWSAKGMRVCVCRRAGDVARESSPQRCRSGCGRFFYPRHLYVCVLCGGHIRYAPCFEAKSNVVAIDGRNELFSCRPTLCSTIRETVVSIFPMEA